MALRLPRFSQCCGRSDTVLIGEIRDKETAELAVKSALTGHRLLSTIHTNTLVLWRVSWIWCRAIFNTNYLMGAVTQRLVRRFDGTSYHGRTALFEYLETCYSPLGPIRNTFTTMLEGS
ncbi:MAG: ATPase, T2SS/T4P/T4SS family [Veillonella sp.]